MLPTVPPSAIAPFDHIWISSSSCFLWASLHWSWLLLTFSPPCPTGTIVASGARLPKVGSTRLAKTGQFENNSQQFKQTSRMACGPTPMVCPPASMPQAPLPARCWTILTSGFCTIKRKTTKHSEPRSKQVTGNSGNYILYPIKALPIHSSAPSLTAVPTALGGCSPLFRFRVKSLNPHNISRMVKGNELRISAKMCQVTSVT